MYARHNKCNTRLYSIWASMKTRCYNSNHEAYARYGGRGIVVCDEWRNDFMSFYNWALSHGYNDTLTIDRIDNNKGYEPNNCRWATRKQQARNLRNNKNITINGETRCLTEWCNILGLNYYTVWERLNYGWSVKKALEINS